ncbi:glycoside hydrolase domain-containing protein [Litchfieldia alkalitelluris]|uniref:glycoside hydrolase domain-containing protein n=1 Tax=Litchfieldia alkalitelluris TaxID=304268 RepID=UPI000996F458|nr:glycoside hydrolase domain-containing protein [Litchfieldia alkalitelluris]
MTFGKYTLISIAAFLLIVSSLTVFIWQSDSSKQEKPSEDSSTTNITITNNVVNNINADSDVSVESDISTDMSSDAKSNILNNVENNVAGDGEAVLSNSIENILNGHTAGSLENLVKNNVKGSGRANLDNDIQNSLDDEVNVDVTNAVNTNAQEKNEKDSENDDSNSNGNGNSNGNDDNGDENDEGTPADEDDGEIVWGIDSASETTEDLYACVRDNFGDPVIFGRYLADIEGVAFGLTKDQIDLIHSNDDHILLIYNLISDARGYDNGAGHAEDAIALANDLGVPEGVALYADIEPSFPVDSDFIRGWFDTISESGYESGIYGIFDPDRELTIAYNEAAEANEEILDTNYIWTAAPNVGITTKENAPEYNPQAPEGSLAWGWQYGLDAETCNIDTNLFNSNLTEVLWSPDS